MLSMNTAIELESMWQQTSCLISKEK